jgi:hypothetical protein
MIERRFSSFVTKLERKTSEVIHMAQGGASRTEEGKAPTKKIPAEQAGILKMSSGPLGRDRIKEPRALSGDGG